MRVSTDLIALRMNISSTVWASYYSSAWEFRPNSEAGVSWFCEFFAICWLFILFDTAGGNALIYSSWVYSKKNNRTSVCFNWRFINSTRMSILRELFIHFFNKKKNRWFKPKHFALMHCLSSILINVVNNNLLILIDTMRPLIPM